jgi:hypothetical protein
MALDIIAELEGLVDALDAEGVDYAVCGGLALGILGHPRMTKDIDVLVLHEDLQNALAIANKQGFDVPARPMVFRAGLPEEQQMHRRSKLDPETSALLPVDFLVVLPIFEDVWAGRIGASYRERTIKVVSPEGLATMKRLAGRPQDLVDIAALEALHDGRKL